jgi:RimJ/RimL family protein N-acetyltransferase
LPKLFHPRKVFSDARQHYICTALAYDWRAALPEGFAVHRIDDALLNDTTITVPEHIMGWILNNWGTREHYAEHGFGYCVVHGAEVVSWSLVDCVSGTRCEIGIQAQEAYRRQGLAAIAAAAAVEYALSSGFDEVGWHCDAENIGSWKTALKVGFVKERDYRAHYCTFGDMA